MSNTLPDKAGNNDKLDLHRYVQENSGSNSSYSAETKIKAVMCYIIHGHLENSAKACGIPPDTFKTWRYEAPWWDTVIHELRKRNQDELDGRITGLIERATEGIEDRIANGDARLTKDGDIRRVPMDGKSLATVAGIMFDKRAAIRGDPITISRNTTGADQLQQLENKFEEFARRQREMGNLAKPVEVYENGSEEVRRQTETYEQEEPEQGQE